MPTSQSAMPHTLTVGDLMLEFSIAGDEFARRIQAYLIYPNGTRCFVFNDVHPYGAGIAALAARGGSRLLTIREAYWEPGLASAASDALHRIRRRWYDHYSSAASNKVTIDRPEPPPPAPRSRPKRHNLNAHERRELAKLVGGYLRGDAALGSIVDFLTYASAYESILDSLPDEVSDHVVYCTCGHFEVKRQACRGDTATVCSYCDSVGSWVLLGDTNEYVLRSDAYWSENREEWYSYDIDADDADDADDEDEGAANIHSWVTVSTKHLNKPEIKSTATGDFTVGVEFECVPEGRYERDELAEHVHDRHRGKAICKEDGSLPDHGLEIVFAPLTLESAKTAWSAIEFPRGTIAWDSGDCGTHVHIDARAFTRLSLAKFMGFWNAPANASLILKIAGRHPLHDKQAKHYADIIDIGAPTEIIKAVKGGDAATTRYRCVNLAALNRATAERLGVTVTDSHHSVYNTVELRIFRASMKGLRTLAQIEIAHASVMFARDGSISGMGEAQFIDWLKRKGARYPNLRTMLGIAHHTPKPNAPGDGAAQGSHRGAGAAATHRRHHMVRATGAIEDGQFEVTARQDHLNFDYSPAYA